MGKDPDTYVYTIVDNKALLKPITLGVRKAEYFEVKEGLKEGDLVVIMGQQRLYDNAPVAVEINNQNN
jgi:multidrug efflux pump subunit AcrA (membrane-fusion protein)